VRLVATNEAGAVAEAKAGFVTVFAPVVAGFTRAPTNGVAPLQVDFTNTSTGATSFSWDFDEDGIADSTATSPSFVYTVAGTYDVTLTATGPGGTDTFTFTNCVDVFGAVAASFTMNRAVRTVAMLAMVFPAFDCMAEDAADWTAVTLARNGAWGISRRQCGVPRLRVRSSRSSKRRGLIATASHGSPSRRYAVNGRLSWIP
jgi:hypothetical protein